MLYHTWKEKNKTHNYEIDFLIDDKTKLIHIEIKSKEAKNHRSINEFSRKYSSRIGRKVLFSQNDVSHEEMLELKPIYLLQQFLKELD